MAVVMGSNCAIAADSEKEKHMDSKALGWLIVVDNAEISAAKEAKNRKLEPEVIEYADLMIDEHTKNLDKTNDVAKTINVETFKDKDAVKLEHDANKHLDKMKGMDDKKFQKEYVKSMVKDHTEALHTLDKKLIPKVENETVKNHLTDTRDHVAKHLEKAKDLKKKY
jgi:putative membrane protein